MILTGIREHLLAATDPVRLARDLGLEPDSWQKQLLRSTHKRVHVLAHRQGGKTTTTAVVALHHALFFPGSTVLIVSPGLRQSQELFRKVLAFYRRRGRPVPAEAENQMSLILENGSRVLAMPASEGSIRGYSVDLLIIDEGARVADDVFASVLPMVAVTKGRVIALSTPAGRRGWFYKASYSKTWEHYRVTGDECPRLSPAELAEERELLGDLAFRQEYQCEFVDAAGAAFSGDDIDAMWEAGSAPPSPARRDPISRREREDLAAQRAAAAIMRRAPRFNDAPRPCRHGVVGRCPKCALRAAS